MCSDSAAARSERADAVSSLSAYGWDDDLETSFAPHRRAGLVPARVVGVDRGRCDVVTGAGPLRVAFSAADGPCTGDWAAVRPASGGEPALVALLPRRTAIVRAGSSRSSHGQVLAANVDTVAVVVSAAVRLNAGRVERLLALGWESGAVPVVVATKADQAADPGGLTAELADLAPGAEAVATSAVTGEGLDRLRRLLTGTVVLLGASGAGKSTLANALLGADELATGAVRAQDGKGRHTTVRREMVPLPEGGVLIDTPGLRGVGLFGAEEGLERTFAEIEELALGCRFTDCVHHTEPGCAVLAAIESGEISARRLDSYRKLQRENAWMAARSDARLRAEREERWKVITKQQRAAYRFRGKK
ncbi:ribosome biogenesis GTPase [Saccharopolyspora erythraea NRRL 2338]|uniref:Small ribosomal subunit biogenesis GTPase RsgA n=2 Tax=Saccharopolyspora erythraea TaxID=1836 RepID=A4FQ86_SACEN|nr:ribosome small subunit-dependent GTPase A [Saccharopolyspora erythraea]EQD86299.1 GTPase RsgA [Saccharopolyspora erythraea D]PFG92811.1 ribosome biogenesis GTPase [Saccharopolyspora erythraea NRRL 2338]QRK89725.1 ribosome small subunit-dependent GTPase A [Saccharopolyspora erythraea]CAM06211.1 putative ATP/GTP-binding protein [Saccharopolyspora erythraea NRRL 2338]